MVHSLIALGFLIATVLVGIFFASIYSLKRQPYLLFWSVAWLLYALHLAPAAASHWSGSNGVGTAVSSFFLVWRASVFFWARSDTLARNCGLGWRLGLVQCWRHGRL